MFDGNDDKFPGQIFLHWLRLNHLIFHTYVYAKGFWFNNRILHRHAFHRLSWSAWPTMIPWLNKLRENRNDVGTVISWELVFVNRTNGSMLRPKSNPVINTKWWWILLLIVEPSLLRKNAGVKFNSGWSYLDWFKREFPSHVTTSGYCISRLHHRSQVSSRLI